MFHFQAKKLLTAYLDGELPSKQLKSLEQHIQSCTQCHTELNELRKLDSVFNALPKQESRTELYWQTQQRNILLKAQQPVSESDKKLLLKPARKLSYWKFAMAGSTLIVACFIVLFTVYHKQQILPVQQVQQRLADRLEPYFMDHNIYPQQKETNRSSGSSTYNISQPKRDILTLENKIAMGDKVDLSKSLSGLSGGESSPPNTPLSQVTRELPADGDRNKQPIGEMKTAVGPMDVKAPSPPKAVLNNGEGFITRNNPSEETNSRKAMELEKAAAAPSMSRAEEPKDAVSKLGVSANRNKQSANEMPQKSKPLKLFRALVFLSLKLN